jgi:hypothetical protein
LSLKIKNGNIKVIAAVIIYCFNKHLNNYVDVEKGFGYSEQCGLLIKLRAGAFD